MANALGIAFDLTGPWSSSPVPHHHTFAIMWFSMIIGALSTLLVIPALLPREGVAEPDGTPADIPSREM